jgi:hypothetical protein
MAHLRLELAARPSWNAAEAYAVNECLGDLAITRNHKVLVARNDLPSPMDGPGNGLRCPQRIHHHLKIRRCHPTKLNLLRDNHRDGSFPANRNHGCLSNHRHRQPLRNLWVHDRCYATVVQDKVKRTGSIDRHRDNRMPSHHPKRNLRQARSNSLRAGKHRPRKYK